METTGIACEHTRVKCGTELEIIYRKGRIMR